MDGGWMRRFGRSDMDERVDSVVGMELGGAR